MEEQPYFEPSQRKVTRRGQATGFLKSLVRVLMISFAGSALYALVVGPRYLGGFADGLFIAGAILLLIALFPLVGEIFGRANITSRLADHSFDEALAEERVRSQRGGTVTYVFGVSGIIAVILSFIIIALASPDSASGSTPGLFASDEAALESMRIIEERVSEMRGLETLQPVTRALLTTDELRRQMEDEFLEDYSEQEARDDVLLYAAFELMGLDVDLYNLLIDLYAEQVAGFYDPDAEEMYVVKSGQSPGALERSTFSHEYTHVLQDQHFDLEALGFTDEDDDEDEDGEQQFAIRCLVEGDATLLEWQYIRQHFKMSDTQEMLDQLDEFDSSVLDSAPDIVRKELLFPYEAGFVFVTELFDEGGWPAVDAAYANPPLSTEQIIHPERYPDDAPQIVTLPPLTDTLGAGWRLVGEDVVGEFELGLYLGVHVSSSEAEQAAEGWGGDRYAVHWREDESALLLVVRLAWDTRTDAVEFFTTYTQFAQARFGDGPARSEGDARRWWLGDDTLLLAQNERDETLVIVAPDEATLRAVSALFPDF